MRLLLDINVILDVVFERDGVAASSAVIARCDEDCEAYLAWHSVATLGYLIERKRSAAEARIFIIDLLTWTRVASTTHDDAVEAMGWPFSDLEDALQAAAAKACNSHYIITRNIQDFSESPIPALDPKAFLAKHPGCP